MVLLVSLSFLLCCGSSVSGAEETTNRHSTKRLLTLHERLAILSTIPWTSCLHPSPRLAALLFRVTQLLVSILSPSKMLHLPKTNLTTLSLMLPCACLTPVITWVVLTIHMVGWKAGMALLLGLVPVLAPVLPLTTTTMVKVPTALATIPPA